MCVCIIYSLKEGLYSAIVLLFVFKMSFLWETTVIINGVSISASTYLYSSLAKYKVISFLLVLIFFV